MDLLFNELSLHGQFRDLSTFEAAVERVMGMRKLTARFGRELYCHPNVADRRVTSDTFVRKAVGTFKLDRQRSFMAWLTRHGPFWEDARQHGGGDYLECFQYEGEVVTDTAVGEAAYCCLHGRDRGLVSMDPSDWLFSPAPVDWRREDGGVRRVDVRNYWDADMLAAEPVRKQRVPVLPVARQGEDSAAQNPLLVAGARRRTVVRHVRRSEDHEAMIAAGFRCPRAGP